MLYVLTVTRYYRNNNTLQILFFAFRLELQSVIGDQDFHEARVQPDGMLRRVQKLERPGRPDFAQSHRG